MTHPLISVVIPTCRRPELLARCLDRLAPGAQTLPQNQYEVLVTDDGEPTVEKLIAERYPWATWGQGPRCGPAANRNAGALRARGAWVAFTDDDCVPDPGWLAGFVAAIRDLCRVYEGKTTCSAGLRSRFEHAPVNLTGGWLWSCNLLIHPDLFTSLGGFDEGFPHPHMEDVDLRERLRVAGELVAFVPEAVVDHPPRRVSSGWKLALSHESDVYYWYKHGRPGLATPRVIRDVLRFRLSRLRHGGMGLDEVRAMWSMLVEIGTVSVLLPIWEWRHWRRSGGRG